jgi:hypothetical protein
LFTTEQNQTISFQNKAEQEARRKGLVALAAAHREGFSNLCEVYTKYNSESSYVMMAGQYNNQHDHDRDTEDAIN